MLWSCSTLKHASCALQVMVALNNRDPQCFDMFRVDLVSGDLHLDTENPGDVLGWLTGACLECSAPTLVTRPAACLCAASPYIAVTLHVSLADDLLSTIQSLGLGHMLCCRCFLQHQRRSGNEPC